MTTIGIVVLVMAFFGTCAVAASRTTSDPYGNPTAQGYQLGQSPFLMIALVAGVALIAVGQARKSNARREAEELWKLRNTTVKVVPDADSPGGPFRGAMKEVEVLDPTVAEIERSQREADRRRGATFLLTGGLIMGGTIVLMLVLTMSHSGSGPRAAEDTLAAIGLSIFPFGLGLFFGIKGLLLRSK